MNRLAEKIKVARLKAKLTEKELAKKCGLSVGYIIQIESGKKIIKEEFADKILKSLGEKTERLEDELPKPKVEKTKVNTNSKQSKSFTNVKPNAQWADALAGVIKKYPVYDCLTNKVVDYKELPILGKKIEGYHPDKIMFVKASNDNMKRFRIFKNDVVTVALTHEIQNGQLYLVERDKKRMIRYVRKEKSQITLLRSKDDQEAESLNPKSLKVIGKCVAVSFSL